MTTSFWQKLRRDFPVTKRCAYLDHASGGPLPSPILEKIQLYYREHHREADMAWPRWIRRREEVREKAARFIHADPEEITFVSSTSQGMNWAADLLAPLGSVLINDSEFPASTMPWLWRKSRLVWQKTENGRLPLVKLRKLLKPPVKTIVTSFVQYATGFRQDLEGLGRIKGSRFLVVNATQGFGAFPVDVRRWNADFLISNSYKWFLAGYGAGIFFIRKKWLKKFEPLSVGWRSMLEPERMDNRRLALRPDAGRYEWGCPPFPAIFAVGAAIDYFNSIGMEKIGRRILELTDFLIEGLDRAGFEVISPREPEHRSGIVVIKMPQAAAICRRLLADGIYVSPRGAGIRIAPHFYNSFEEIGTFLKKLTQYAGR